VVKLNFTGNYAGMNYSRIGECGMVLQVLTIGSDNIGFKYCHSTDEGNPIRFLDLGDIPECTKCLANTCEDLKSRRILING
jgi:hypothetical protein